MNRQSRIVLFDLGGVLADLGDPAAAMQLNVSGDQFWRIWLQSPAVRAFELGKVDIDEFCDRFAVEVGEAPDAGFRERLENWRLRLFDGVDALIATAITDFRLALLSNTNALHWQQVASESEVFGAFDTVFLSFETGHYKPDAGAFEQVIEHFGCVPGELLFLDDTPVNVDAARGLGIEAHVVSGPAEAARVLNEAIGAQEAP